MQSKAVFGYDYLRLQENSIALKVGPNVLRIGWRIFVQQKQPKKYPPKTSFCMAHQTQLYSSRILLFSFIPL